MKFGEVIKNRVNHQGQNYFPLAARLGGISRYCAELANFETKGISKLQKHVTL